MIDTCRESVSWAGDSLTVEVLFSRPGLATQIGIGYNGYTKARDDDREALKLNPNELTALNIRAWLQATCPEAEIRDGKSAVEHAAKGCQLTQWRVHGYVSTLAAAYAEVPEGRDAGRADQGRAARELPGWEAGAELVVTH